MLNNNFKHIFIYLCAVLTVCTGLCAMVQTVDADETEISGMTYVWPDMTPESSLKLSYASQFSVDYYPGGVRLINISGEQKILLLPHDAPEITDIPDDFEVVSYPVENIYLAATSAMDHFRQLKGLGNIAFSSQKADSWYIDEAKMAMQNGEISYAGKYSAPDYELLVSGECGLAVENTMIYHSPEVLEQLKRLGIPSLVERSSYEEHPLGRMEWIKLYASLIGKDAQASEYFDGLAQRVESIAGLKNTGKTVAFFSINSIGAVNVRKSGDYIAKSINMAGGQYISYDESEEENALSTMNIQMETFYSTARDADVLIYNSTIEGEIRSIEELLAKSPLLGDFKAVQNRNAWCIEKNFYQQSLELGELILDVHAILTNEDVSEDQLYFLRRLN